MPPPPSLAGAAQRNVTCASPGVAVTFCGAVGRATTTTNHSLMRPSADRNDVPVTLTEPRLPVSVMPVTRPPHCSLTVWPFWSVPDRCSRDVIVSDWKVPIAGYAAWIWLAVTVSVQLWLFQLSVGRPSH